MENVFLAKIKILIQTVRNLPGMNVFNAPKVSISTLINYVLKLIHSVLALIQNQVNVSIVTLDIK